VVATTNDPTCHGAAIRKRPGRFDRVVQFRNPVPDLRREITTDSAPCSPGTSAAGAQDLKTSISATGFVSHSERTALR
jgi:hypothetical protein